MIQKVWDESKIADRIQRHDLEEAIAFLSSKGMILE